LKVTPPRTEPRFGTDQLKTRKKKVMEGGRKNIKKSKGHKKGEKKKKTKKAKSTGHKVKAEIAKKKKKETRVGLQPSKEWKKKTRKRGLEKDGTQKKFRGREGEETKEPHVNQTGSSKNYSKRRV